MLQLFIRFAEFTEFNESSIPSVQAQIHSVADPGLPTSGITVLKNYIGMMLLP